ncbi:MAG TPA: hypothetical protein VKK61_11745 [Tepidisphaeraceae bacterium]|nr:hypothetical protein [Tepidisphaeraceae bacterium]
MREEIELVLVTAAHLDFELDEKQLASFGSYQLIKVPELIDPGQGFAAGIRGARAAVVAYVEEHSFPEPTWGQALLSAHAGPYAAVGCTMGNANPDTLCSWSNLFEEFGPVVAPAASGVATYLGGHHTSYKRDILLSYGDALPNLMDNETALHIDLRQRGHQLYLAGDAVSNHVNFSQLLPYFRQDFVGQRSFAATRAAAQNWSAGKRALYCFAAPIIPFVLLIRIVKEMRRARRAAQLLPQALLLLIPAIVCGTIGETVGYIFGDSPANIKMKAEAELDRLRFVTQKER